MEADITTAGFDPAQPASLSMGRIPRALSFSGVYIFLRPLSPSHDLTSNVPPLPLLSHLPISPSLVDPYPLSLFPFFNFEPRVPPWLASHPGR